MSQSPTSHPKNLQGDQSIEKEVKTGLSLDQYLALFAYFQCQDLDPIHQYNYYFDTDQADLKGLHCGLRYRLIRSKTENRAELTLKTPIAKQEKEETTSHLSLAEGLDHLKAGTFPDGLTTEKLKSLGIDPSQLHTTGQLFNTRYEITTAEGIFALDKSQVQDGDQVLVSYELEFEYVSEPTAFFDLLEARGIAYRKIPSKLKRALSVGKHIFSIPEDLMV